MRALALSVALGLAACAAPPEPRYASPALGLSFAEVDGWQATEVGHDVRLTSAAHPRQTIVVRAVAIDTAADAGADPRRGDAAAVADASARTLAALPGYVAERSGTLHGGALDGTVAQYRFTPPGAGAKEPYRRVQALLRAGHHLVHVIQTAPATDRLDAAAFDAIVKSVQEAG